MLGLSGNPFLREDAIKAFNQYKFFFLGSFLCSTPIFKLSAQRIREKSRFLRGVLDAVSILWYMFLLFWAVSYIMIGSHNPFIYFNF